MTILIAGVDEAGRGPWAGPVSVAAVILDPNHPIPALNDSKKLTEKMREVLFDEICAHALAVSAVFVSSNEIDRLNIREATLQGMTRAVQGLAITPHEVLIDGRDIPPSLRGVSKANNEAIQSHRTGLPRQPKGLLTMTTRAIIGGDGLEPSISAASIIAKVLRDRAMVGLDAQYPGYGFAQHKGYGTAMHAEALQRLGACAIHRKSFAPIREVEARHPRA